MSFVVEVLERGKWVSTEVQPSPAASLASARDMVAYFRECCPGCAEKRYRVRRPRRGAR